MLSVADAAKELQDVRRRLRKVQRQASRLKRKTLVLSDDPPDTIILSRVRPSSHAALAVFHMSDRNSRLTAQFLQVQNKLGVLGTQGLEQLMRAVEDAYLEAPLDDLATLFEDTGQRSKQSSLYTAGLFVQQHRLYNWIVRQNSVHGVAPGRIQLIEAAKSLVPSDLPLTVRGQLSFYFQEKHAARCQRKWLAKFCKFCF